MRRNTYKLGLTRLGSGLYILCYCMFRTSVQSIADAGRGAVKHPILAMIIIFAYLGMCSALLTARAERDKYNEEMYNIKQRNDTLELLISKPINNHD